MTYTRSMSQLPSVRAAMSDDMAAITAVPRALENTQAAASQRKTL
jgi:hypothetical protein